MAADTNSEEDFVTYGTPLEPLEEDEPLRKPVPLHEQTVKDEKGRYQRFHGAFTGGFSAGYFNTVGSKEGWAPSTFVSSRQQKAEQHNARPEDFMDEEDFSEHGIAPREISTSKEFWSVRRDHIQEKARVVSAQAALIPGDTLLEALITPARCSVGVELLRRMGWKEGQGVGPRVKRKARRQHATDGGSRIYSCALPPAGSEDSEGGDHNDDDEEFAPENATFAPKDVTPVDFTPKVGVQGLGYRGLDPGLALQSQTLSDGTVELFRPQCGTRRRGGVAGQAFGIGALEDEDDEVYHRDSMCRYDTVLGGEEPGDGLYGWTAPQQYKPPDRGRDVSYIGKVLEGFTFAQKAPEKKTVFLPPTLPKDYRPVRHLHLNPSVSQLSNLSPALAKALTASRGHMPTEEPQQRGHHLLDSGQRRALLGEEALQGPSSVLELLRPEDRERLINVKKSSNMPAATSAPQDSHGGLGGVSSSLQQEALAAWRGAHTSSQTFKPFQKNPSKQARYELYLSRMTQGDTGGLEQSLDPTMTEWECSREQEEFARASILYRPSSSSSALSSRFVSARQQEDEDSVAMPVQQEDNVDDRQSAVKMKMFGQLTRKMLEWHPDKLLCKRFNVPDPYPGSGLRGLPTVKRDKFSVFNFLTATESRVATALSQPAEPARRSRWDVSDQDKKNREEVKTSDPLVPYSNEQLTQTVPEVTCSDQQSLEQGKKDEEEQEESRPPMDLFKAIFASSSSSSEEDSSEEKGEKEGMDTKEEEEPAQDLFNIVLVASSPPVASPSLLTAPLSQKSSREDEEFGPKLPPPTLLSLVKDGGTTLSHSPQGKPRKSSREKKHKNKRQHKHKEKKKKHRKKRHKGKQSKKTGKREASDSSADEDGEDKGTPVSTQELLQRLKKVRSHQSW